MREAPWVGNTRDLQDKRCGELGLLQPVSVSVCVLDLDAGTPGEGQEDSEAVLEREEILDG